MLEEKKKDKMLSKFDLFKKIPEYIKNYPFLSEVDSCSLRNSITDLMIGFDRYYKKLGGYPNYQKRGVKESYRTNCNRSSYKGKEIILTERLKVKEMLSKENNPKSVRKSISNVSFQTILQTIEYKCKWSGKTFHQISTYYPSSQICSECGYKDATMKDYGKREYICPVCKTKIERDYNASRNILQEGLRELKIA